MTIRERRFTFELVDKTFFEPIDRYEPDKTCYINLANSYLPADWNSSYKGVWNYCNPPVDRIPYQGWKIHLSATPYNARAVLTAAIPVLVESGTAFKFAVDRMILTMMTSKGWTRGGSGKFMTIYPEDETCFRELVEALHRETKGLMGPYILSDRRYKDSGVVYYRYGTFRPLTETNAKGDLVTYFMSPDGQRQVDERNPMYTVPDWVVDPFPADTLEDDGEAGTLCNGRYRVEQALSYSNTGGVYLCEDLEQNRRVVIKEARQFVGGRSAETDAIALLKKEYRIMKALEGTGCAPVAYDLFRDWENWFLVQEYVEGVTLQKTIVRNTVLLRTQPTEKTYEEFGTRFVRVLRAIAAAMAAVHERGIALGDLSPSNILVSEDLERITLIDFEAACQLGVDMDAFIITPGYVPAMEEDASGPSIARDHYALAAIVLAFVFPMTQFFRLMPERLEDIVREIFADAGVPEPITSAVIAGLSGKPAERPSAATFVELLDTTPWKAPVPRADQRFLTQPDSGRLRETILDLRSYIESTINLTRKDRLYPSDFRAFETNPLSLGYGAYGTLFALHRAGSPMTDDVREWLAGRKITGSLFPPGFLTGQAGIAWALTEMGDLDAAKTIVRSALEHPLLNESNSLYEGRAGVVLSALRIYLETRDEEFLDAALRQADALLLTAHVSDERGLAWREPDEKIHLGLGYGSSGVALVLLYASLVSGQERYLDAGLRSVRFDLAMSHDGIDGKGWSYVEGDTTVQLPYYMYGSAGVGSVLLRYRALAGIDEFDAALEAIYSETDRKYSLGFGKMMGLAGIAGFRYDAYRFTGEERHLSAVGKVLSGLDIFRVPRETGLAYPTDPLDRISCDYGYGTAGILATLSRLLSGALDELTLDRYLDVALAGRSQSPGRELVA